MSCPYYQDFTRECLKDYPTLIKYHNIIQCDSNDYPICIFYNALQNDFRCKHLKICTRDFPEEIPKFNDLIHEKTMYDFLMKQVYNYCLSKENHISCARYKILREEKMILPGLVPDGTNVNYQVENIHEQS